MTQRDKDNGVEKRRREARERALKSRRSAEMGMRKARAQQGTRPTPKEMVVVRHIARPTGVGSRGGSKTVPVMAPRRGRGKMPTAHPRTPIKPARPTAYPRRPRKIPKQSGR